MAAIFDSGPEFGAGGVGVRAWVWMGNGSVEEFVKSGSAL
jgi:hypothetical protein